MVYCLHESSIGVIGIAESSGRITNLWFGRTAPAGALRGESPVLSLALAQVQSYLAGTLTTFTLPLEPQGTPFMRSVWSALEQIPYGQTVSYGEIARSIGSPGAVRAVGQANNRNPIAIVIPCHRVIGKDGSLTGYAGGLELKQRLLDLERQVHLL